MHSRSRRAPLFAEAGRDLLAGTGRLGNILPTGIATDATTQYYFKDLVDTRSLASLYDFENALPLFEGVHRSYKFCLLTLVGRTTQQPAADFAFFAHHPTDLQRPNTRFPLTPEEITLLNPNTGTCPIFRTRRDAEITLDIYKRIPILIREGDPDGNPWNIKMMQGLFNMTSDSPLFRTRDELEDNGWTLNGNRFFKADGEMLPLYEAKMIHQYDYRWATFDSDGNSHDVTSEKKQDQSFVAQPRYWVAKNEVDARLTGRWNRNALLGFRNIARSTDARTLIATMIPRVAVGHSMPLVASDDDEFVQGAFTSFVLDFVLRQKLGGINLTFNYMQQLPLPSPSTVSQLAVWSASSSLAWITERVRYLNEPIPRIDRREVIAEIDAAFFYLYEVERDDLEYIMESFPIVKRKDISEFGEYRTKHDILKAFDAITQSDRTGVCYPARF